MRCCDHSVETVVEDYSDEADAGEHSGQLPMHHTSSYLPSPRTSEALSQISQLRQKLAGQEALVNAQFLMEMGLPADHTIDFDISKQMQQEQEAVSEAKAQKEAEAEERRAEEAFQREAPSAEDVLKSVVARGTTLRQLLEFYEKYTSTGKIKDTTSVEEVLRIIVLPETANPPRSYMESEFMKSRGGARRPAKLVALSWKSSFLVTLVNIVLDATKWTLGELASKAFAWPKGADGKPALEPSMENVGKQASGSGAKFQPKALISALELTALDQAYWVCIFAVNEHRVLCGDCSASCRQDPGWGRGPVQHLQADTCQICKAKKRLPCSCGARKYRFGHSACEAAKFSEMLGEVKSVVVSLDGSLDAFTSLNVVTQLCEAATTAGVELRAIRAFPLAADKRQLLMQGSDVVPAADSCQANHGEEERDWILQRIGASPGGATLPSELANFMLKVRLGQLRGLSAASSATKAALQTLSSMAMDFSWAATMLSNASKLLGEPANFGVLRLTGLQLRFGGCKHLTSLEAVGKALATQAKLEVLSVELRDCAKLQEQGLLGLLGGLPPSIKDLDMDLRRCGAIDNTAVIEMSRKLPRNLERLDIDLRQCPKVRAVAAGALASCMLRPTGCACNVQTGEEEALLVRSIAQSQTLNIDCRRCPSFGDEAVKALVPGLDTSTRQLFMRFTASSNMTDDGLLALCSALPPMLETFALDLAAATPKDPNDGSVQRTNSTVEDNSVDNCVDVTDSWFPNLAAALPSSLRALSLNLSGCASISSRALGFLAEGMPPNLETLSFSLRGCTRIDSGGIAALAGVMPQTVVSFGLQLKGCHDVADGGLAALAAKLPRKLERFSLELAQCRQISDKGLVALAVTLPGALTSFTLDLEGCAEVTDAGLASLTKNLPDSLEKLNLNMKSTSVGEKYNASSIGLKAARDFTCNVKPPKPAKPAPPTKLTPNGPSEGSALLKRFSTRSSSRT